MRRDNQSDDGETNGYECDRCGWTSGPEMPQYLFGEIDGERHQIAHCRDCKKILDTRPNTATRLGERFPIGGSQ